MSNPFPGMNPYLERPDGWTNVHGRLIAVLTDMLDAVLPPGYVANIEERCRIVQTERGIYPDILVKRPLFSAPQSGGVAIAPAIVSPVTPDAPRIIQRLPLEPRETYINIVDAARSQHVVATIEVLSPVNKASGEGQNRYIAKQEEIVSSHTHLVEIDLLRTGQPTVSASHLLQPDTPHYNYIACLHRGGQGERCEFWPNSLRERLPRITIPLAASDPDALLDLQVAVDYCYERGRFERQIDYAQPPDPPLTDTDAAWADLLLRERSLRPQ